MRKYPITLRVYPGVTLEKVIEGVEDLLLYYQQPRATRFDKMKCSLCRLFDCEVCLWVVFHHMCCEEFAHKKFDMDVSEAKKLKEWKALRIKELTYWLEELKRPGVQVNKWGSLG